MDVNELIPQLAVALVENENLETWCQEHYERSLTVFLNHDPRQPPGPDDCPCVCVLPARKQYGGGDFRDTLEFVTMVHDETAVALDEYPRIIGYAGVENVEDLRRLVLAVLAGEIAATPAGSIGAIDVEYDTVSQFPFVTAAMAVEIIVPWTLGDGDPALME